MCSRIGNKKFSPREIFGLRMRGGKAASTWGFYNGDQYNARSEKLYTSYKKFTDNKGILTIESFWESGREFVHHEGSKLYLATITNNENEFAILTMDAIPQVKKFHPRMPVVLNPNMLEAFLESDIPVKDVVINPELIVLREEAMQLKLAAA